jgi:uncharacterized membrane protein
MEFIPTALAQTGPNLTNLQALNLTDIVYLFAALGILIAGGLSIVFIFFGGFSFILSGGDEGKVKEAIHTIRYAIIGLVIALLSIVIVPLVGKLFGLNFNFLDFATLSDKINLLFGQFKDGASASSSVPVDQLIR